MASFWRTTFFALSLSLLWLGVATAKGPVMLSVEVPSGKWKAIRLRDLPKDAVVAVGVESSGEISVVLLDSPGYRRFPALQRPLFLGQVEKNLSFSVSVPAADNYFLVFDNRSGRQPRALTVAVRAARGGVDQIQAADAILREFERQLHQLFIFEPFSLGVERCGAAKAFTGTGSVDLCAEYVYHLNESVGNKEGAQAALAFSIFHEVARALLAQWHHPLASGKETADELATVLMIMINQERRAATGADYFSRNPSIARQLSKLFQDDRHPLAGERARAVLRWLKDPQLARRWQGFLVPHMQTVFLQRLRQQPRPWTDRSLVERELSRRDKSIPPGKPGFPKRQEAFLLLGRMATTGASCRDGPGGDAYCPQQSHS